MKKPVVLLILDGLGIGKNTKGNAVEAAKMPVYKQLITENPKTQLQASGFAVGLPDGQMGNSEVGHLNIGAGRVVYQELTRISQSIEEGHFFENDVLRSAMHYAASEGKTLHLMGLVSDGGVHSHLNHLYALLEMAKFHEIEQVAVHCFLDGRDTSPQSALDYIEALEEKMISLEIGKIATISGRYYAMDRDKRWDRTEMAYKAMVTGEARVAESALDAINQSYYRGETDEFVKPTVIKGAEENLYQIKDNDAVIFFNFRPDRARQMTRALVDEEFSFFERPKGYIPLYCVTMTQYDKTMLGPEIAFAPQSLHNTLGEVLSKANKKQLRIAETEKYAHVTYFLNGGVEVAYEGEERILVPSPKVATYDLQPEMSAAKVTEALLSRMESNDLDLIIVNFANPDMVGHTGVMDAVVKALETVDECLGRIVFKVLEQNGAMLITSDHGNSEELVEEITGKTLTAHTTNPVPLIAVGMEGVELLSNGKLCDLAPTLLEILGLEKPKEMTGKSLLKS